LVTNRFRPQRLLHRSATAAIVLCDDAARGQPAVIKALHAELAQDDLVRERFVREADLLQELEHPGIVPVLARGSTHEGSPFYAMPYFARGSLADRMLDPDALTVDTVVGYGLEMLDALQHVHEQGVVHRDIKPGNVLLDKDEVAMLCDFGIAAMEDHRTTRQGAELATPGFAPPEQIADPRQAGPQADLYAVGVTLFVLCSGRRAVELVRPATRQASLERLPQELAVCVAKATEPVQDRRYESAAAMADVLADVLT